MNHHGKSPVMVIDAHCSQFARMLQAVFSAAGLSAFQSFDLRSTRALHEGCTCPNHGTRQCTCELIVLLVYLPEGGPLTVVLDGRDAQTFVFLADEDVNSLYLYSAEMVKQVVQRAASNLIETRNGISIE